MIATSSQNWHAYQFILDWIYTGKKYHPQYIFEEKKLCLFEVAVAMSSEGSDVIQKNNAIKAKTLKKVLHY